MNIIVVGCGKVGYSLASQLNRENHNVTIIDNNEKVLRHAVDSLDVMGIIATLEMTIRESLMSLSHP